MMQRYRICLDGRRPLIMHNSQAGLDKRSPANKEKGEIAKRRGRDRTIHDDERLQELECQTSLWLDETGSPTIPTTALRSCIETAARKLKQGPQVREGLLVEEVETFNYDRTLGTTVEELGKSVQFTTNVVIQRNRIPRTRAKFDEWGVTFVVEADDELVDVTQLEQWLSIAGRRIGLGDWRPEKSGDFGRFALVSIAPVNGSGRGGARQGDGRAWHGETGPGKAGQGKQNGRERRTA